MSAVNKVILLGNLGVDPAKRFLPSGGAVTNFRMATSEVRRNKSTGQTIEHTEWHRVVLFDRLAEVAAQYLTKGASVYIEGKLRTRKWQAQDGSEKYVTEVVADEMQFLGGGLEGKSQKSGQTVMVNKAVHPVQVMPPLDDSSIPF